MASVRKRNWINPKGSRGQIWQIEFKDEFGKRKVKSGFKTKVLAEAELIRIQSELQAGRYSKKNNEITFKEASQLYIELHSEIHCKESTTNGYKSYLKYHLLPYFGEMKLVEINKQLIERFIQLKHKEGLSNQSINHLIILTGAIFQKMVDDEALLVNPVYKVKKLRITQKEFRTLELNEVYSILNTAKKHYPDFYPILFTALFTGMRRGELIALTWDMINWKTSKINIKASYHKGLLTTPKSVKSIRKIDMSKELSKILKEWKLKCPHSDKNLVFPSSTGHYLDADNMVKRRFEPILRRAGIDRIRWHDLRHTYASLLIAQNVHIKYIQNQMGHGSIQVTMDIYGHIMPEVNQMGINALDNIFNDNLLKDDNSKIVSI